MSIPSFSSTCDFVKEQIMDHYRNHPALTLQDLYKFLHQSTFGCEHMVTSLEQVARYLSLEADTVFSAAETEKPLTGDVSLKDAMSADSLSADTLIEPLCGPYSRVSLTWLKHGLSVTTLAKLFYLSANAESANSESANTDSVQENSALRELFIQRLALVEDLIKEGLLPFTEADFHSSFAHWEQSGFDAFHHSQPYRDHYHPAYRVISHRYIPFLPLLAKLDSQLQKGPVTLAVEGGSASGKSTLGALLCELYGCTLFHMDDYFLRPFQRTKERLAQPGGNVDRERFLEEILLPLSAHRAVTYQPYDCSTGSLCPPVTVIPQRLTVIEGAYSMHPELACYYDLSAFLDVDPALQTARIQKRNSPAMAQRFFNEWIPLEQTYFEAFHIKDRCTLVIPIQPCYNRPNCV